MELAASWYEDDEWRGYVLAEHRGDLAERHIFDARDGRKPAVRRAHSGVLGLEGG
jgi:hypothetical protein